MKKSLLILTGLALTCNQISAIGYSITVKNETPNDITVHVTSKSKTTNPITIAGKTNQKISTESGPRRLFWSVAKAGGDYRTKDEYSSPDEMTITDIGKKFDLIERSAGKIIKEHKNQTAFVIKADNETLKKELLKATQEKKAKANKDLKNKEEENTVNKSNIAIKKEQLGKNKNEINKNETEIKNMKNNLDLTDPAGRSNYNKTIELEKKNKKLDLEIKSLTSEISALEAKNKNLDKEIKDLKAIIAVPSI